MSALFFITIAACMSLPLLCAKQTDLSVIRSKKDVSALFASTPPVLTERIDAALSKAQKQIDAIIALQPDKRSYATVAHELDKTGALSDAVIMASVCSVLERVTTDDGVREAARKGARKLGDFFVDAVSNNKPLYQVFKTYAQTVAPGESLTAQQRYYVQETMREWQQNGFDLPDEQFARCSSLKKEISKLNQDFAANIAQDKRTITVKPTDVTSVDPDFIAQLTRDAAGDYVLGIDYPTVETIMATCSVESTRKAMYLAFNNRAHPANQPVLERLIAARDELARLLGMADYNQLSLCNEMVETPQRALDFLHTLINAAQPKQQQEIQLLMKNLPQDVSLTQSKQLKPWDITYIKDTYKKKHLELDEELIAQYFPMQSTVDGLLHIYEQFFNLKFERVQIQNLWHEPLTTLAVHDGENKALLGYLILDMHPRAHKYTHACHANVIPSVARADGAKTPALSVVLANFPPESATKPALLKLNNVRTFFHEFGHALHAVLGRTEVASYAGTKVKRDFVELPSQMLEEWLWDAAILKQLSKHYLHGSSLPDELIAKIQANKTFDSGHFIQRQAFFALAALAFFDKGETKDLATIWQNLSSKMTPDIACEPGAHAYAAFGHLTGYGPRYYGYLWSKVFALDMFEAIKKEGLLNPVAGKRYVDAVLKHGGSKNPNELLSAYLGRKPNQDAFLADQGLVQNKTRE